MTKQIFDHELRGYLDCEIDRQVQITNEAVYYELTYNNIKFSAVEYPAWKGQFVLVDGICGVQNISAADWINAKTGKPANMENGLPTL